MHTIIIIALSLVAAGRILPNIPRLIDWPNESHRAALIRDLAEATVIGAAAVLIGWGWV